MHGCFVISALTLAVKSPESLAKFYSDVLGMQVKQSGSEFRVGYGGSGACLVLCPLTSDLNYSHDMHDRYWKISITLPDLNIAYQQLVNQGVTVSKPHQFRDIGYMCHLADPEGFVIELLQHSFEGNPITVRGDCDKPLGGGAQIGLITLRTNDIDAEFEHCQKQLGMKYLCRQSVSDIGFDLYFFAFTDETPPNKDVNAVENREWLYQRQYTVLEFQYSHGAQPILPKKSNQLGAAMIRVNSGRNSCIKIR